MKIRIGVFFGGRSVEHEISIISALQAIRFIDKDKYEVIPVYMAKDGDMYTGELLKDIEQYKEMDKLILASNRVVFVKSQGECVLMEMKSSLLRKPKTQIIDIAFPIVHGTNTEDGSIQGYLRTMNIPFVGPDVLASAVGMDKILMKQVLMQQGIDVVPYVGFDSNKWAIKQKEYIEEMESKLDYPMIVKPANLGSSIGIKTAKSRSELIEAINNATRYSMRILVEKMIVKIREINCSVLGDFENQEVSVCEEPISGDEILSFADKYMRNDQQKGMQGLDRKIPADLEEGLRNRIENMAIKTFAAIDCSGVVRIDFIIDEETDSVFVNEINTIPGSLAFYLWEPKGKNYKTLLDEVIKLGLKRERENKALTFNFDTNILSLKGKRGIKK